MARKKERGPVLGSLKWENDARDDNLGRLAIQRVRRQRMQREGKGGPNIRPQESTSSTVSRSIKGMTRRGNPKHPGRHPGMSPAVWYLYPRSHRGK